MARQTFKITGLHCPACKKLTEKRIGTISGVSEVTVDVNSGSAQIEAVQEILKADINKVLEGTGYNAE